MNRRINHLLASDSGCEARDGVLPFAFRSGQSLVEVLVALVVMSATALLVSGSLSTYRAAQEYARDQAVYQGLARERLERLLRERPGEMMGALTREMDLLALAPGQQQSLLVAEGTGKNAVDVSSLAFIPLARSQPEPDDPILDLMRLSASAAATKLQPLGGPGERWVLYKYQVTISRVDDSGANTAVYVLSGVNADHEM